MLRLLINLFLFFLVLRLIRPAARSASRFFRRMFSPTTPQRTRSDGDKDYSKLTPYEIEDADYEEVEEDH